MSWSAPSSNGRGGTSVVQAVADALVAITCDPQRPSDLEGFHCAAGDSSALQGRLRRMWENYEDALTMTLSRQMDETAPSPRARLAACQLVALVRSLTSDELRVQAHRRSTRSHEDLIVGWIREAAALVENGLGGLPVETTHLATG